MIRIITDSASDITQEQARSMNIDVAPLGVSFGEDAYTDGVNLTGNEFYERLINAPELPKTSQPAPDVFTNIFAPYVAAKDDILCILLSSKLSGTCQSAHIAAAMEETDCIRIVDTDNVCLAQRLIVEEAVRLRDAGATIEELERAVRDLSARVRVIAVVPTLKYLKMGGRLSAASAAVGTLLKILPVVEIKNGVIGVVGKARSQKGAYGVIEKRIEEFPMSDTSPIMLGYSYTEKLMDECENYFDFAGHEVRHSAIGAVIGTHAGPGACGFAYFER